ncbi:MAG: hypothetical protein HFH62_04325 [Lachnospiraceae bacterium]|nr:hypothetical protein [Lachnospiraceae bacterium]
MTTITKKINLNVSQPNNYQLVHAMQGDSNTAEILATIWDGNKIYSIDCDQISLEWQSPSGSKRDYPVAEHTQHTATFLLKKEMLVENGDYAFCIRFDNSDNDVLRTFPSTMRVIQAPFGQLMDSEIVTLTELVNKANNYKEQAASFAANAENSAKQAQSYAIGTGGTRPNESTDSAKYYYEQSREISQGLSNAFISINTVSNGNFDNVLKTGYYAMHNSSNGPTNEHIHSLIVFNSTSGLDTSIQQIAIPIKSDDIYIRHESRMSLSSVSWSAWVRLPNAKDLNDLKKSVSDGKSAVASAITEMGVSTESDAAFETMAGNVEKIKPSITVGGGVNGTWNGSTFTYGGGCGGNASINGKNTVSATASLTSGTTTVGGNASASDVLSGKTFSSNHAGREIAGSMPNHTNVRKALTGSNNSAENGGYSISGSTMRVCPATGYHDYTNTAWENCMQIEVGNASASDVLAGKRFTSSAGRNVEGNIINARATGAKQFGASFPVASSGYPYFCLWYLDHVSYSQFGLHYTINTNNLGSVIGGESDQAIIRVTGGGGTINVLRSSWSFNASNFNRMVVSLYGKSSYVGGSLEFRGCVGVCAKGATSSTGAEGRDYALSYGAYQFTSTSSAWHSNIVVDLSHISQEVQFHMSTVHAGEVYVNSIGFIPN